MRSQEALALTENDVDFINQTILINKAVKFGINGQYTGDTKTHHDRKIVIGQRLTTALKQLVEEQPGETIFNYQGKTLRKARIQTWIQNFYKNNPQIKHKITIHGFRHTHVTLMLEQAFIHQLPNPIKVVSERVGHNDFKTTMKIYNHITDDSRNSIKSLLK
jgi:integrase